MACDGPVMYMAPAGAVVYKAAAGAVVYKLEWASIEVISPFTLVFFSLQANHWIQAREPWLLADKTLLWKEHLFRVDGTVNKRFIAQYKRYMASGGTKKLTPLFAVSKQFPTCTTLLHGHNTEEAWLQAG